MPKKKKFEIVWWIKKGAYICGVKQQHTHTMETIIVKANGNEVVNSNLQFRILMNGGRLDMFIHETYSDAKSRLATMKRIFKHSSLQIVVIENH